MKKMCIYSEDRNFVKHIYNMIKILDLDLDCSEQNTIANSEYIVINRDIVFECDGIDCEYCFINMDLFKNKNVDIKGITITYGLGNKNTITLSSLEQENIGIVYCVQRYISMYNENIIEPQEIPLNIYYENESYLYAYMVIITIALIQGAKISNIESKIINSTNKF
ncbi:hypothetical protein P9J83_14195 [Clostridium sporogenes]|uniref:Uncharacterized protein n=1 Tax=Clostridium sporogenes TaxID=1509 RepID=A0AAE4FMS3_CLOSG|nr:hypothetical protein [Clostridium sporogenes]MDS1004638.1 hypothetical protein [Clostridium sporogenes]